MAIRYFHELFSDQEALETRVFVIPPGSDTGIPEGEYGLLEMFCDNPDCNCRHVLIAVQSRRDKRAQAVVSWEWGNVGFHREWMGDGARELAEQVKGPVLDTGSYAAPFAPAILNIVCEILARDTEYVRRIKRHYLEFKIAICNNANKDAGVFNPPSSPQPKSAPILGNIYGGGYCTTCGTVPEPGGDKDETTATLVYMCERCSTALCTECTSDLNDDTSCPRCDSRMVEMPRRDALLRIYVEPVGQLLHLGKCDRESEYTLPDFCTEHVPLLIQMAIDMALSRAHSESTFVWAPVHAWRALGRIGDERAIEPLISLFHLVDDDNDDYVGEVLPACLADFGSQAIAPLVEYLQDDSHGVWARVAAAHAIFEISQKFPETRDACVSALTATLNDYGKNDEELNALLISWLVDLNAVESAEAMRAAFSADAVELSVRGDWEEVQIDLGLLKHRITPRPRSFLLWKGGASKKKTPQNLGATPRKNKKNRQNQKKSRKKNRRK